MTQAAKQRSRPQFASIEDEIEWHKENKSNILIPTTKLEANEFYKPVIDEVSLSIEQGDAYPRKDAQGKQKYAPTMQGLNRLAICADIEWDPRETRRIDNGTDKLYVVFQARGGLRKADGSSVWHSAVYELDLEIVREEIEEQHRNKCKNWNKSEKEKEDYVEFATKRDWREKRRRKLTLTESGAKARVLRPLLGIKSLYTKEELAKPFIMIRYIFQPPFNDPDIRRQVTAISLGATNTFYDHPRFTHQRDKGGYINIPQMQEPFDLPAEESEPDPDPELTPAGPESGSDKQVPEILDEAQWEDATLAERMAGIRQVAAHVGYDLAAFEKRAGKELKELETRKLTQLYKNLCSMRNS